MLFYILICSGGGMFRVFRMFGVFGVFGEFMMRVCVVFLRLVFVLVSGSVFVLVRFVVFIYVFGGRLRVVVVMEVVVGRFLGKRSKRIMVFVLV